MDKDEMSLEPGGEPPQESGKAVAAALKKLLPKSSEAANSDDRILQSEEPLKLLIDTVPQVIWANDGEGRANYFNKRWFDYCGLTFEQSAGLGWQAIAHAAVSEKEAEKMTVGIYIDRVKGPSPPDG
jgi:PAS domain-containing protein